MERWMAVWERLEGRAKKAIGRAWQGPGQWA